MQFGKVSGVGCPVSRFVLGSAGMTTDDRDGAFELLDRYVELGGNAVDTAHIYGVEGSSEQVVGEWLTQRDVHSDVVVIVKGACTTSATPELVSRELSESLERLQVESADIYMMHRDNPAVPSGDFVEVLNEELRHGRVQAIGGSNWLPRRIDEANTYAEEHGLVGFAASSPNFSLAHWNEATWANCYTASDDSTRRWYESRDVALFAWSSQAGGFFTGRFAPEHAYDPDLAEIVRVWFSDDNFDRLSRAERLAEGKGRTANQIALAYVISQRFNAFALIGPRTPDEVRSSMDAADLRLSEKECAWLDLRIN